MLKHAWTTTRRAFKRRFKAKRFPFLAIFESTEAGEPHLHILTRVRWIEHAWLSAKMDALIGAPVVDVRRVRSQRGVARYVAKYTAKDPVMWPGTKRYWCSLDWEWSRKDRDRPVLEAWQDQYIEKRGVWTLIRQWYDLGWTLCAEGDTVTIYHPTRRPP